ncbi:MAG: hypothetical protein RBT65_14450 [Methanolobus sp.]|nr:hypothetical protein [Methanolobus sp.]
MEIPSHPSTEGNKERSRIMLILAIVAVVFAVLFVITVINSLGRVSDLEEENHFLRAEKYELNQKNDKLILQMRKFQEQILKIRNSRVSAYDRQIKN